MDEIEIEIGIGIESGIDGDKELQRYSFDIQFHPHQNLIE